MTRKTRAQIAEEARVAEAVKVAAHAERVRGALRWTEPAGRPDVPPPTGALTLTIGWTFNRYTRRVSEACSSVSSHAVGRTDDTDSQRPKWLYSTKRLALLALRNAMEAEFAEALAAVDKEIEEIWE